VESDSFDAVLDEQYAATRAELSAADAQRAQRSADADT
jgi:hypothetical protein